MTFPRSSLVGLNPVAIGASNDAFMALNLGLDRLNRLQLMYMRGLAFHVVNVQRRMMGGVTAVDAPGARLKIRKPLFYEFAVLIGRQVYVLPVARLQKSVLAPGTALISSRLSALWPGAAGAQRRTVLGAISLSSERISANSANPINGRRIFPGRHNSMISAMNVLYPCKPDIFAETYEAVGS